jgi:hypothetical protein
MEVDGEDLQDEEDGTAEAESEESVSSSSANLEKPASILVSVGQERQQKEHTRLNVSVKPQDRVKIDAWGVLVASRPGSLKNSQN